MSDNAVLGKQASKSMVLEVAQQLDERVTILDGRFME